MSVAGNSRADAIFSQLGLRQSPMAVLEDISLAASWAAADVFDELDRFLRQSCPPEIRGDISEGVESQYQKFMAIADELFERFEMLAMETVFKLPPNFALPKPHVPESDAAATAAATTSSMDVDLEVEDELRVLRKQVKEKQISIARKRREMRGLERKLRSAKNAAQLLQSESDATAALSPGKATRFEELMRKAMEAKDRLENDNANKITREAFEKFEVDVATSLVEPFE